MILQNKTALITGAGSGIGKAAALLLAREGAFVGALSDTAREVEETVRDIEQTGGKSMALVADVSEDSLVSASVDKLVSKTGRIDIVFANAGINGVWAPLEEISTEEWDKTLAVNLKGTFLTVKYALPHLKKRGGSIVVTSSVNGTRMFSNSGATAYSCSKAAQVAFTKMIALELGPDQVRANVICPGAITTSIDEKTVRRDMDDIGMPVEFPEGEIPLTCGKPGTAEEVAQLVLFLASDASRHITGTEVWIDGGQSLLQG